MAARILPPFHLHEYRCTHRHSAYIKEWACHDSFVLLDRVSHHLRAHILHDLATDILEATKGNLGTIQLERDVSYF